MKSYFEISNSFEEDSSIVIATKDSLEEIKNLPNEKFKLILTSPPYNIGKSYETQTKLDVYLEWQENILVELVRILHSNGSLVLQVGTFVNNGEMFPLDFYFYPICKKLGLQLRNRIVWHFEHGLHSTKKLSGRYEVLLWFTKTKDYTFNLDSIRVPSLYPDKKHFKGPKKGQLSGNPLGKNPSDFWEIIENEFEKGIFDVPNVKNAHPEKTEHPCQFPVEIAERCVLAFTDEDDWILDPFGGVGSTLIASIKNNRKAMSIDRDEKYSNIATQRVCDFFNGNLKLRKIGTPISKPKKPIATPNQGLHSLF
jgi:DNA modification methylase